VLVADCCVHHSTLETMKLLRLKEVIDLTGLSRSTVYRYEASAQFPKRRRTGPNAIRWIDSEVLEWIASRPTVDQHVNVSKGLGTPPANVQ
jgi:prophage regulatory protein